jgi:hypothetical protein
VSAVLRQQQASSEVLANYARYRSDPWDFLCECVWTKDQVDQKNPVKKFPSHWPYLRFYVRIWEKALRIAVPKSRRMTMSWTNIGLYLWATIFHPDQDFAFVSKKEDDAAELVRRAEFIFDHIPEEKIPKALLPTKGTKAQPPALIFTFGDGAQSKIQGFPMGADQLRQFTFSGILGDECAFWPEARKFYSAAGPTTEGGGRMTLISSRSPGFFQRLCYDALDHDDEFDETPDNPQYPLGDDSVIYWRNKKNQFHVLDIHYTANPNKRDEKFVATVKESMPIKDWLVEYERNWDVYDGRPVFEDYSKARHESRFPLSPHLGLPLLCGWDFGLTPACIVAQLREGTLYVLREFVSENKSIDRFAPHVMQQLRILYPEWSDQKRDFRHYIDPAGLQEAQTDQRTCAGTMAECGLKNISAGFTNNAWEPRRKAVEKFLLMHSKAGAGLQLYPPHCTTLAKGFAGGYQYPEKYAHTEPGKPAPIKNKYSHPHDALQYLCGGAQNLIGRKAPIEIPTPQYTLTHEQTNKQKEESSAAYGIGDSGGTLG